MDLKPGCGFTLLQVTPNPIVAVDLDSADLLAGQVFYQNVVFTLSAGETQYIELKTGADVIMISRDLLNVGSSNVLYSVLEAPAVTDGTPITTAYNGNRNSGLSTTALWYSAPTGVSGGTALVVSMLPATAFFKGRSAAYNEMVYKANTTYVASIVNAATAGTVVYATYRWHKLV